MRTDGNEGTASLKFDTERTDNAGNEETTSQSTKQPINQSITPSNQTSTNATSAVVGGPRQASKQSSS